MMTQSLTLLLGAFPWWRAACQSHIQPKVVAYTMQEYIQKYDIFMRGKPLLDTIPNYLAPLVDADKVLVQAKEALNVNNYQLTMTLLTECIDSQVLTREELIYAYMLQSETLLLQGALAQSQVALSMANELFSEQVKVNDKLPLLTSISVQKHALGLHTKAAKTWLRVGACSADQGNVKYFVYTLLGISTLFELTGFHSTALFYLQKALTMVDIKDNKNSYIEVCLANVSCFLSQGKLAEAEVLLKRISTPNHLFRSAIHHAKFYLYQGMVLREKGKYSAAISHLQDAKKHALLSGSKCIKSRVQLELALCFITQQAFDKGIALLEMTLFNLQQQDKLSLQYKLKDALSHAYYAAGDFSKALHYEQGAHQLQQASITQFPVGTLDVKCRRKLAEMERLLQFNCVKKENKSLKARVEINSSALEKLQHDVFSDALTGIYNRRWLDLQLSEKTECYSLLLIDVDHFKSVNDTFSHLVGDLVLKKIAGKLDTLLRQSDSVSRYGGEEFVVLLNHTTAQFMPQLAERLRHGIENENWEDLTAGRALTVSIGGAVSGYKESPESVLKRADAALYRAKETGRNRCCFAPSQSQVTFQEVITADAC